MQTLRSGGADFLLKCSWKFSAMTSLEQEADQPPEPTPCEHAAGPEDTDPPEEGVARRQEQHARRRTSANSR
eukprot:767072-Hanusia_phi.AAC.4